MPRYAAQAKIFICRERREASLPRYHRASYDIIVFDLLNPGRLFSSNTYYADARGFFISVRHRAVLDVATFHALRSPRAGRGREQQQLREVREVIIHEPSLAQEN